MSTHIHLLAHSSKACLSNSGNNVGGEDWINAVCPVMFFCFILEDCKS